jgi:hypothetical protein
MLTSGLWRLLQLRALGGFIIGIGSRRKRRFRWAFAGERSFVGERERGFGVGEKGRSVYIMVLIECFLLLFTGCQLIII